MLSKQHVMMECFELACQLSTTLYKNRQQLEKEAKRETVVRDILDLSLSWSFIYAGCQRWCTLFIIIQYQMFAGCLYCSLM